MSKKNYDDQKPTAPWWLGPCGWLRGRETTFCFCSSPQSSVPDKQRPHPAHTPTSSSPALCPSDRPSVRVPVMAGPLRLAAGTGASTCGAPSARKSPTCSPLPSPAGPRRAPRPPHGHTAAGRIATRTFGRTHSLTYTKSESAGGTTVCVVDSSMS